ncbi:MAG: PhoH family protein [Desulfomonilaceae bacterium]
MGTRYRRNNGITPGNRSASCSNGFIGDRSILIPNPPNSSKRLPERSSSKISTNQVTELKEGGETEKKKIIVVDTSVLVHDPESLDILRCDDTILAIPWMVLEELDQLKNKPDIGWDAREVIRKLEHLARNEDCCFRIEAKPSSKHFRNDLQKTKADHQIIATARALQAAANGKHDVLLMSRDTIVRVLARELGIKAEDYPHTQVNAVFHSSLKRINVPEEMIPLPGEEFEIESRNWEPLQCNEGVVCWSKVGSQWEESFAALYKSERFKMIPSDIAALGLRPYALESNGNGANKENLQGRGSRQNWSQHVALAQVLDPGISLVFLQGGAGTGKTLIALAGALEQRSRYTNIVIARPMVHLEDRDEIGFLPGGLEEKMAPWIEPIQQAFSFLGGIKPENRELIAKLRENKKIIIKPLDYIRGETYHKSFMVIDEAQNLTPHQVKTIITRAGTNTKMVFTGDLGQIDRNRRLDRKSSGLAYAMSKMANQPMVGICNFKDTVRSPLAGLAEELL